MMTPVGIYDRDYYRERPRAGFGVFAMWSVTTWLIVLNVVVFFADHLIAGAHQRRAMQQLERDVLVLDQEAYERHEEEFDRRYMQLLAARGPISAAGFFSVDKAIYHGQIWRLVTFQFLHASPMHLVMNMIGLFLFGQIVEGQFGPRRYLAFYLLCGVAGALAYVLLWAGGILIGHAAVPMVGASAGVFGVMMAAADIAPEMEIWMWFGAVPVRVLAWFSMAVALLVVLRTGPNAGGEAAHLGGGILGFVLIRNQHWLNFAAAERRTNANASRRARRRRTFQKDWSKDMNR
jgi:membrane associated rhomboid family serine protease